jgi:hypothetical protein
MSKPLPVKEAPVRDTPTRKLSSIGATEDEVDMKDTVPQRIDKKGTKIEDQAGTGKHDSAGG